MQAVFALLPLPNHMELMLLSIQHPPFCTCLTECRQFLHQYPTHSRETDIFVYRAPSFAPVLPLCPCTPTHPYREWGLTAPAQLHTGCFIIIAPAQSNAIDIVHTTAPLPLHSLPAHATHPNPPSGVAILPLFYCNLHSASKQLLH